jgi:hypothetical protein
VGVHVSLDGLLADEGTEYWQFCFGLPVDPADLKQKIGVYQSAYAHIMGRAAYEGMVGALPTAVESSSTDRESPAEETYETGEKAIDYQFTVTKIKCGVRRVGDTYSNEKAQGQFCLVGLRVRNIGDEPINFSDENQALIDTKAKEHSPDDAAWIYLDSDPYAEINPRQHAKDHRSV